MSEFLQLRIAVDEAEAALHQAVTAACPGPHKPIQHRDRKPKWCHACGRDWDGFNWRDGNPATETSPA